MCAAPVFQTGAIDAKLHMKVWVNLGVPGAWDSFSFYAALKTLDDMQLSDAMPTLGNGSPRKLSEHNSAPKTPMQCLMKYEMP